MSHEAVWYSRPRTYGKGSRAWYVTAEPTPDSPTQIPSSVIVFMGFHSRAMDTFTMLKEEREREQERTYANHVGLRPTAEYAPTKPV